MALPAKTRPPLFSLLEVVAFFLSRLPQAPASEPLEHHVLVRSLQLRDRRQQFVSFGRAERRRRVVDQDGPVRESWGHVCNRRKCYGTRADDLSSRFSFSTSVVRFRFSRRAAAPLLPRVRSRDRSINSRSMFAMNASRSRPSSGSSTDDAMTGTWAC